MNRLPISGAFNDGYAVELYEKFRRDPASVDESWRQFFRFAESLAGREGPAAAQFDESLLRKVAGAGALLGAIERYGHLAVQLDPLGAPPLGAAELKAEFYGITEADLFDIPASALAGVETNTMRDRTTGTAADVVAHARSLYCSTIGYEFDHLEDETQRDWFRHAIEEKKITAPLTPDEKRLVLQRLTEVDGFERFLGLAFVNVKRFSIEGIDALVPMIDEAITRGARAGARSVVIAVAPRVRLNVLTPILGKPYQSLVEEFFGHHADTNSASGSGDVKYHLGYRTTRTVDEVGAVEIELMPNPSHLEFVNPVLEGVARARQRVEGGAPGERDEA